MKNLGIDARLYYQTGVGTYIRNLLYFLHKQKTTFKVTVFALSTDYETIKKSFPLFHVVSVNAKWHTFAEQLSFYKDITSCDLDLMHFTYFSYPVFYSKRFISTVHDLTPLLFKTGKASTNSRLRYELKYQVFKYMLANQIKKSERIITPTNAVKEQILNQYSKAMANRIIPIYEGMDEALITAKEDKSIVSELSSDYFLYVGNFYPHKNILRLIEAFKSVSGPNKLLLVGPDDYFAEQMKKNAKLSNLSDSIIFRYNVSKSQLKALYKCAKALIHPSLSEGFGLPVLEAASCGCQIIASDIPVFNEILNGKYSKFDPQNIGSITNAIQSYLKSPTKFQYSDLKENFSFESMAKKHTQVYSELLS